MIPFAVESHGAIGESARQLLSKLASRADDTSGHAFLQQAYAHLSVALHAANAAIALGGLQRLRVSQLSGDLPMSPGLGGYPSRRHALLSITVSYIPVVRLRILTPVTTAPDQLSHGDGAKSRADHSTRHVHIFSDTQITF